jgi:hypothetical protein
LRSAEVVNARVEGHVGLEVETRAEVDHDAVDSPLEVVPSALGISMLGFDSREPQRMEARKNSVLSRRS